MMTETPQTSALESLTLLMQQHEAFGQRLATLAQRAKTEMQTLETEAKSRAAELDEARGELVELRAAREIEKEKLATAEARIERLEAHIRDARRFCDDVLAGIEPTPQEIAPDVDAGVDLDGPTTIPPLSVFLGVSASMLAALAAIKGASSPEEMMRMLLVREFRDAGLLQADGMETDAGGEEVRTARSRSRPRPSA